MMKVAIHCGVWWDIYLKLLTVLMVMSKNQLTSLVIF